jgi:hypothetical protein
MELTVTNRSQAYPKGTMVSEFGKRIEKGNVRVTILCAVFKIQVKDFGEIRSLFLYIFRPMVYWGK